MILILLATLISVGDAGCPSMCNCSESSVLCIQKDLESIPSFESLVNDPIIIDLSGNKINMVDSDDFSFDKSDKVKEIYLNSTELLDIDSEAFNELENLQELYLGDNLLNSLPETLIEDLSNMILLDISNNHFSGDMPKLISKSLEVLAVANSKVTNIPTNSLKDLPNLKMLLLQQNNINSIDPIVFESINKNSFFVRLSYNMWDCSCDNIELFEFLSGRQFVDTSEPYECLTDDGKYVNVYDKGVIQEFKGKCLDQVLRNQVTKDLSAFKEDKYIIEVLDEMRDEEFSMQMQNSDKAYSLVKENNETSFEDKSGDDDIVVDYGNDEEEEEAGEDHKVYVKKIDYTKENGLEIIEYEDELENVIYNVHIGVLIAVLSSFLVGVIFGYCVNKFAHGKRNLETSDSTTKLILP